MSQTTRKSRALAALAVGGLMVGAAACGGGAEPPGPAGSTDGGGGGGGEAASGEASAWLLTSGRWPQIEDSFDRFNEAHESSIAVQSFANDAYKERIRTAVGSGEAPTLILGWGGGTLVEYVNNDYVVDITEQTEELRSGMIDSVVQNGEVEGATYAVPMNDVQPVVLYYNIELFEQVGAEVPTTWDELMQVVETFNEHDIAPFSLAGQSVWPELMWIQYLTDRIGGPEAFQRVLDGEEDAWSDPAIISALEHIQELTDAGGFIDGYGSVSADQGADAALVHTGQAAMLLQGSWVYGTFLNDAQDFVEGGSLGFANFPAVEEGQGDPANIVGNPANYFSVSSDASEEEQQVALDYLNEGLFDEQMVQDLIDGGAVPPLTGLEDQLAESDNAEFATFAYEMVQDAPHFQLSWDQALPPAQAQELLNNLSRIFLGEITPEQFADNMNATL